MTGLSASTLFRAYFLARQQSSNALGLYLQWSNGKAVKVNNEHLNIFWREYTRRTSQSLKFSNALLDKLEANEKELAELRSKVQQSDSVVK